MSISVDDGPAVSTDAAAPPYSQYELLGVLWERRRWLCKCTLIGLVVATVVAFVLPKEWESSAQLMPPDSQSLSSAGVLAAITGAAAPSAATGLASSLLGTKTQGAVFVGILQSRTVQDDLIDRFDLRKVYWCKRYRDARKKLAKSTAITEDKKSGIITIAVRDNDPYRARDLALGYVQELDKLVARLSTSAARREREFLEQRLVAVKQELDISARELAQFASRNATIDMQNQGKAMLDAAARLQGELIAAESELRGLEAIYSENNVRVRALRARIGELQDKLRKMSGTGQEVSGADLRADELYPSLRKLPLLAVNYSDLYRRARIQETIFEILTKQYELAKVQEAREIPTVKVLDAPDVPEKKAYPPRLLIMAMGTLLVFVGSGVWVYGTLRWCQLHAEDPLKVLVTRILDDMPFPPRMGKAG
jgi:capsule polysaccharide export protein KpsE/RkpR